MGGADCTVLNTLAILQCWKTYILLSGCVFPLVTD
jgi:hypothetical protein